MEPLTRAQILPTTAEIFEHTPFVDIHTHLFAPRFGDLALWGIDSLLTYHYLEAELFRFSAIRPEQYWQLSGPERADLIWKVLFVENPPLSEATQGVCTVLHALGLDSSERSLTAFREFFRARNLDEYIPQVFRLAGVSRVVMTNDPLDPCEIPHWTSRESDPRFQPALRLDRILNLWPQHWAAIRAQGYEVEEQISERCIAEVRRFLEDWAERMQPAYMAVSLPETFAFPAADIRHALLKNAVLPVCRERRLPLALMIGVRRQVNPELRLAGDGLGRADLTCLAHICEEHPENRFLVTVLSRENQHELCVYARKFSNLMPFGCWWFLNNDSIVEEITRERFEMLGLSFIPQNSDARVLEQLIYKWRNTRRTIAPLVAAQFGKLADTGRAVRRSDIESAVIRLFQTNFEAWTSVRN